MSWENELRPEIKFTSPRGNVFYAKWRANERSFEVKLGQFDSPKFSGTIVQDMDVKSTLYPLTIFFDGMFHTRDANDFYESLKFERGQWEVIHPVKGPLILQLVSIRESISPVESGNITEFDMQWIEPANITRLISPDELAASLISAIISGVLDAFTILEQLRADLYSAIQSAINTFNKIVGIMDVIIAQVAATVALAKDAYDQARAAYTDALEKFGFSNPDTSGISQAVADMSLAPTDASADFSGRYSYYVSMLADIADLAPTMTTVEDYNKVVTMEYGASIGLLSIAQIVATSEFSSRAEVIAAMENIMASFNTTVAALETVQSNFIGLDIDFQYFSQTKNYTSLINVYSLALRLLTSQFYNLQAEKIIVIKNPTSPLALTVQEYGSLGENDANYDLFIASNQLSGNEIELLPAGKEVRVYVG